MGLLSASITALYARDSSYLRNLPLVPHLSNARTFASGRSVFFGFICLIVILILAYVTNPSEASFRTCLTEQVFRRHLQRLHIEDADDNADIESLNNNSSLTRISDGDGRLYSLPSHKSPKTLTGSNFGHNLRNQGNKPPRVHFTNRSAVSLQTPAHVFRSYGICTIAVTQDIDTASPFVSSQNCSSSNGHTVETAVPVRQMKIRGTWFIGAFGKWWVGGVLEISKEDLLAIAMNGSPPASSQDLYKSQGELKDGRYEIKVLDQSDAFEGLSLSGSTLVNASSSISHSTPTPNGTGKKTRSRASTRSIKQTVTPTSSRGSSPTPSSAPGSQHSPVRVSAPPIGKDVAPAVNRSSRSNSNANSSMPTVDAESKYPPDLTKAMQDITKSQAAVQELREQLSSFQSSAFASQAALRLTLEDHRARKKQEDAVRVELKGRTKTLEESKRNADTRKREADKKLKNAQSAQDSAVNRMHRLKAEIETMKKRVITGEERVKKSEEEAGKMEMEIQDDMEKQKIVSKTMEDSIGALTTQAKQLEETLGKEKDKLSLLKEECDKLKQKQQKQQQEAALLALQAHQSTVQGLHAFGSMENIGLGAVDLQPQGNSTWNGFAPLQAYTHATFPGHSSSFNPFDQLVTLAQPLRRPSDEMGVLIQEPPTASSSRFRSLSLGELSGTSIPFPPLNGPNDMSIASKTGHNGFSPFDVDDRNRVTSLPGNSSFSSLGATAVGLLPTNLVTSMETESPVSLLEPSTKLESRGSSESRWKSSIWPFKSESLSKSTPASTGGNSKRDFDPFDAHRVFGAKHIASAADSLSNVSEIVKASSSPARKWFSKSATVSAASSLDPPSQVISAPESASLASKSRLNPDAKVFSLPKGRSLLSTSLWTQGSGMAMPPPLNVRPTGLHLIPALDDPSSFSSTSSLPIPAAGSPEAAIVKAAPATKPRLRSLFSSPFAPSPAEREALQRALEKNLSHDRISVTSEGSAEGRMPPSPFGIPPPTSSLFDLDEEDGDSGWGSVLKSASERKKRPSGPIVRQTSR
ncbi:hypothetical protein FRC19_011200 [Serendipita sp. 401]|nr:hypothetical protein FRC15_001355 [Serendipita sp. 397]KAG8825545.1 hypothetical protein FRC19_011200 [Serendipita sp. 401]